MRKITYLLTLLLAFVSWNSLNAQTGSSTGWYAPGERLDVTQLTAGTDVFIYSMCRVNGTDSDFSRFIINSGNAASTLAGKPAIFMTSNVDHIWKVRSAQEVTRTENVDDGNGGTTSVTYTGTQITFSRKKGSEEPTYYWGIDGVTNATAAGNDQTFVLTQWKKAPYVSSATKSGTDVWLEDVQGNAVQQSALTESDKVYLMSALSGKSINTNGGDFQTGNANGYPVALYAVNELSVSEFGLQVSTAPTATSWAENTKWYKMKMERSSWRYVETGYGYTDANGKLTINKTASSNSLTGAWAVVGDNTNGYRFYNMGEGPSKVLGITGSEDNARTAMVDASNPGSGVTTTFDITYSDGNWYIKKHGTTNEYINNRSYYVALWNHSTALGNSGSAFVFEPINDVSTFATASQTRLLNRVGMWKKVPAIWAGATTAYDALNVTLSETVTNEELVRLAEAQQTARAAFVSAVDGVRVTASNRDNATAARIGAFMYMKSDDSNKLWGRTTSTLTMDEVFTLKANSDFSFKIYNANVDKYVGTPTSDNGTSAVAVGSAVDFDLYTSNGFNDNVVVFCINGTATMHLYNSLKVGSYSSTTDMASRWLLNTDVSRHDLKTAINNATTWKTNLETLIEKLATAKKISVKPISHNVILPPAITKAQTAFDASSGTQASRTAAATVLNAALTKAQGAWLGELGTAQQFRLKNHAITTESTVNDVTTTTYYYLTMGQTKSGGEGNAILAAYAENDANQIFTLVQGTGSNAGKYILVSNNKQLTDLGAWNTDMTDAGTPYAFEEVDLANSLFRVRTTKGLLGPNSGVTGATASKIIYSNHTGTRDNLTWELEFIAPTLDGVNTTSLRNIYDSQTFVSTNNLNIINQTAPSLATYNEVRTNAKNVIDGTTGSTITQLDVNTAEAELKAAYSQLLTNFISEADPTQGYRLVYYHATNYTAKDLLLTFKTEPFTETNAVNALQLKPRSAATAQTAQFVSAGSDNSFYIVEGFNKKQVGESSIYYWNPMLVDDGKAYTIEYVTLEGIDGIVARLKNPRGYLGCDVSDSHPAVAANDHLFTNNSEDNYWIIQPCVSPDLVTTLYNKIAEARRYEGHIGTALGQYSTASNLTNEELISVNDDYTAFVNETGSYGEKTNVGVEFAIDYYNSTVFPININQPEVGKLYRFKGKVSGKYMCPSEATPSTDTKMAMNADASQPATIFILKEGDMIDGQQGYKLLNYSTGYYTKKTHNNGALAAAANSVKITASETAANLGYYTLKSNESTSGLGKYLYDNNTVVDRNGSYAANNCDWQIEEVTELPISVTTGYSKLGTLVSPISLNADDTKLKFYTGYIDGTYLKLTEFTGSVIPANVPFLIEYQEGSEQTNNCSFLQINGGEASLSGDITNVLQGGLETVATPTITGKTIYTLQKTENNTQEFWRYTGTTVKGCRAYLPVPNDVAGALSMIFEGGTTTAIEEAQAAEEGMVIYDLSGRRVQKASKGLYIVNGKKVYVK